MVTRRWTEVIGPTMDVVLSHAGGWSLEGLVGYDPSLRRLYVGGGRTRTADSIPYRYERVASFDNPSGYAPTPAAAPDGSFYAAQPHRNRIVRIERDGTQTVVAGDNGAGFAGDGGAATAAQLSWPGVVAIGSDGSVYFTDQGGARIRRIDSTGTITTIAGNGVAGGAVNVIGAALDRRIVANTLAVDRDGNAFFSYDRAVHQITPDGQLTPVMLDTSGLDIVALAADPDGSLWVATYGNIMRVAPGGETTLRAGNGVQSGEDGPGLALYISPVTLVSDRLGGVYFGDREAQTQRHLSADGYVSSLPAKKSGISASDPILLHPDGELWQLRNGSDLGRITTGMPDYGTSIYQVPRENGLLIDVFDSLGRPTEVVSAITGARILRYEYTGDHPVRAVDADGNVVAFERDGSGRLTAIVGVNGERTTLAYDAHGTLAQVDVPGGQTHRMSYDGRPGLRHLLTSYTDPAGNVDRFEYDSEGLLTRNIDPAGGGWTLTTVDDTLPSRHPNYTHEARTNILTSAEGRTYRYTEPKRKNVVAQRFTTPDGLQSTMEGSGVLNDSYASWTRTEADGTEATATMWLGQVGGKTAGVSDRSYDFGAGLRYGTETLRSWDLTGDWLEQTTVSHNLFGDGARSYYTTRYRAGQLDYTTPVGRAWQADVDSLLRPIAFTIEGLAPVSVARDSTGRLTHLRAMGEAGESGVSTYQTRETVFGYHGAGNGKGHLASVTDPLGASTHYAYDPAGRLTQTTLPDGRQMNFDFDLIGNLTALTTPAGITHRFRFDAIHQPSGYDAPASTTDWHYDRDRYLIGVTRPGGERLTLTRDIAGRVTRLAHGAGQIDYGYDAFGRIESAQAGTNRLQYHRTGSLVTGTEWQGDINGRIDVVPEHNPHRRSTRQRVEAAGARVELTQHIDGADRPVAIGTDIYTATPGLAVSGEISLGYAPHGAVSDVIVGRYPLSRKFNDFGETVLESHVGLFTHPELEAMRAAFVATAGALKAELLAQVHGSGSCARRGWLTTLPDFDDYWVYDDSVDEAMRAQLIAEKGEAQLRTPDYCTKWIAGEFDQILQAVARNDVGYDWANWAGPRLTQIMDAARGGAAAITALEPAWVSPRTALADTTSYVSAAAANLHAQAEAHRAKIVANTPDLSIGAQYRYARDALGRIATRTETVLGTQREHAYTYDPAGRLTAHDVDGVRTEWTFDANGNRTHENGTKIARYDGEDRLTAWRDATYTYTPAGDLQSRTGPSGTTTYTYDALGSLHQVTLPGGTRIDYVIDPQGRRIGKKKNGALQYGLLYQDALNPIAELGPDGRIKSVFLYAEHAHAPAAMVRDGKLYRFVTDHLGSIRVVIDTETGTIAQQLDYDVWGKVTLDTQPGFQPFGFAGGVYDPDIGLTRFGARDYDGETGRWTAKDPILFAGGDTNLYGYVLQDPVNWVDPTGEFGIPGMVIGMAWDLGWQLIVEGKSMRCVDIGSVLTSGAIGAVTPGWIALGRTANRTRGAVTALESQLSRAQTGARKAKIEGRVNRHMKNLEGEVVTQGVMTGVKKLIQSGIESKPWTIGSDCECQQ